MINKIIKKFFLVFLIFINSFFVLNVNGGNVNPENDFASDQFIVPIGDITGNIGHTKIDGATLEKKTNNLLILIIEILMVAIGVIALFIISIGAGYMIFYNGNEEFLKKGRNMISTGFLALFIALSSYYIMNLVRYILYN
ncbi:MAG: hypothetical protein WC850_03505 [Candidatus Gracilibacteria bacterium]